ncbi:MAG: YcaO-like family protein [Planctomycetes bacterium]|nr:YcaO-like family protein [Planctomycetota bacterium]
MSRGWADDRLDNRYTGLFTSFDAPLGRPHDPDVPLWAGSLAGSGTRAQVVHVGGAGWTPEQARAACLGEAIERFDTRVLDADRIVEATYRDWPLEETAVAPERWVLFHPEQYALPGFPFRPFTQATPCRWACFREAGTGATTWIPEEFGFLFGRAGAEHGLAPSISTGLSCGRWGDPVLLRGLQEVVERDALVGAWWGAHALEEWPAERVFFLLGEDTAHRVRRPHLGYRFYRVRTPFTAHATIATVEGEDREGFLFSTGAACRETRAESFRKALLEALQGWHYVRFLKGRRGADPPADEPPRDFSEHALYYALHPERLDRTPLRNAPCAEEEGDEGPAEGLDELRARLGVRQPVLFRNVTPPSIAGAAPEWYVLKVVVPGLQPLHGHHHLPHLGGSLWAPRGWAAWQDVLPHPFA